MNHLEAFAIRLAEQHAVMEIETRVGNNFRKETLDSRFIHRWLHGKTYAKHWREEARIRLRRIEAGYQMRGDRLHTSDMGLIASEATEWSGR